MASLRTVGHGTAGAAPFAELLGRTGVELLVDVRSFPGSRKFPHFGREQLQTWLLAAGVEYRWEPRLGGRRKKIVAAVLLRQVDVLHIGHDGRLTPHAMTSGVRLAPGGGIAYDVEQTD
jgi:uncharacterized protein (DUF488 family)